MEKTFLAVSSPLVLEAYESCADPTRKCVCSLSLSLSLLPLSLGCTVPSKYIADTGAQFRHDVTLTLLKGIRLQINFPTPPTTAAAAAPPGASAAAKDEDWRDATVAAVLPASLDMRGELSRLLSPGRTWDPVLLATAAVRR